ncbi:MAG: hypothetical protein ABIE22_00030 [archaeon]
MPKYHFKREEQGKEELKVIYEREVMTAHYLNNRSKIFELEDMQGSLILIDHTTTGLNKIHFGRKTHTPHLERSIDHAEGPRLDLCLFDLEIAQDRMNELMARRGYDDYLEKRILHYLKSKGYNTPFRLSELAASPATLEKMIGEQQEVIASLKESQHSRFLQGTTEQIESIIHKMQAEMQEGIKRLAPRTTRKQKKSPKNITSPSILDSASEIYNLLQSSLLFIYLDPNFNIQEAQNYWQNIMNLAEQPFPKIDFKKYDPTTYGHIARHFPGSKTVGSKFTPNCFQTPIGVLDFAFSVLKKRGYDGEKVTREIELPGTVGLNAVVPLKELPDSVEIKKEMRDDKNGVKYKVNVALNIPKTPTNTLTFIAGPVKDTDYHAVLAAFPGKNYPDIGEAPELWKQLAFISD